MLYFLFVAVLCSLPVLNGCSPSFNWRDAHLDQTPLSINTVRPVVAETCFPGLKL